MKPIILTKFKPFWFDGNLYFKKVDSPKEVKELMKEYNNDYLTIRRARIMSGNSLPTTDIIPHFGFYREYRGKTTLGLWIDAYDQEKYFLPITKMKKLLIWIKSFINL